LCRWWSPSADGNDYPQSRIGAIVSNTGTGLDGSSDKRRNTGADHNSSHSRVSSQKGPLLLESSKEMPHIAEVGVYDEPD